MEFIKKELLVNKNKIATFHIDGGNHENTLVLVHGGPGSTSLSLRDTHNIYGDHGFNVLTWDQLGCGQSDQPEDDHYCNLSYFVGELKVILDFYKLKQVHLLGRSWGGLIAQEFTIQYPNRIKSLILGATTPSCRLMQKGFEQVKKSLGDETLKMMRLREIEHTTDHPEYQAAVTLLLYRHFCRLEIWPDALKQASSASGKNVMTKIFGKYLFNCTGLIKDYDSTSQLMKLNHDALIMHGEYDYISIDCAILLRDCLKNSEATILKGCSHMSYYENPALYHQIVLKFLSKQ